MSRHPWWLLLLFVTVASPAVSRAGARPSKGDRAMAAVKLAPPSVDRVSPLPEGGCFGPVIPLFEGDQPRLCPEQPIVAFVRGKEGDHDIWARDLRDGKEYQVTKGPEDDLHPDWQPDCQAVVFSRSEGPGTGYDIWRVAPGVKFIEQLTHLPGDEMVPRLSPIIYSIQGLHPESCGGPTSHDVTRYHKIVFAHRQEGRTDIRFVSDDGMVQGMVREKCEEASWSSDGLGMLFNCGGKLQLARATQLDPSSALARLDHRKVSEASRAIEAKNDNDYYNDADKMTDREALLADPLRIKLFLTFGEPTWKAEGNVGQSTLSFNQLVALGTRSPRKGASGLAVASTLDTKGGWTDLPLAQDVAWPAWSPCGKKLYFSCNHEGLRHVCVSETTCPLQEILDLVDYPELTRGGLSSRLTTSGFVARESNDKEFFHILEKARYAGRGILVTPDMLLQSFADVVSRLSQDQEKQQAESLLRFLEASLEWVRDKSKSRARGPSRSLAVGLAVPAVLLRAGIPDFEPEFPDYYEPPDEEEPKKDAPDVRYRQRLKEAVEELTEEWYRDDVVKALELLETGASVELAEGELGAFRRLLVDFSMARPRGHYDAPGFRQYFQAVTWLGIWPVPLDHWTIAWAWWLAPPCAAPPSAVDDEAVGRTGGMKEEPEADGEGADGTVESDGQDVPTDSGRPERNAAALERVRTCPVEGLYAADRFAGALAGPPALPGAALLVRLVRDRWGSSPMGNPPGRQEVVDELRKAFGPVEVRTLEDAVGKKGEEGLFLMPKRVSEDSRIWKRLTHPDIEMRGIPQALDVLAVFGAMWVSSLVTVPEGESWSLGDWTAAVEGLMKDQAGRIRGGEVNLNDRWLALLAQLASDRPDGALPRFMDSDPYRLRLLLTSLAGLAQVKHQMVLYSFQNYGVECDAGSPIVVLYEQPVKPRPAVYLEPLPRFYRALAALCREAAPVFDARVVGLLPTTQDCPDPLELGCDGGWDTEAPECPGTCMSERYDRRSPLQVIAWVAEVLAGIADKELQGEPLDEWEYRLLHYFGATLEELFLVQEKRDSGMTGADQGRQERGVTLVADVYTNVQRRLVLHEAVGKPFLLFAHVPFDGKERIAEGAMLSYYEFTHPSRLDDASWWEMVGTGAGKVRSYLPEWAQSFVEW